MNDCLIGEVSYRTSRSSGPGGQHVNKTESRVELIWNPGNSKCLDDSQKTRLKLFLGRRLTDQGELLLASEKYRSQYRNKEDVTVRFLSLVSKGLIPPKKRTPTRPTRSSQERRIKQKKIRGDIKRTRRDRPTE
ncbi:MAG: aminoacyl-tRNA hydrolase [Bacteroidetes bacterium]|nr:aminoacyl-tRNA hydrolase [Bacteroidota bacterium]